MNFEDFKLRYQKKEPEKLANSVSKTPLVSVLVQTYNHSKYIKECLNSILSQEVNFKYEILLGEDNSKDATREICIEYAEKHPDKIRLFLHQDENKIKVDSIPTGNFNALYNFFKAKGKYIAFCEGDDYWTDQHKLQSQVDILNANPDFILSFHQFDEKYESRNGHENQISLDQPSKDLSKDELSELIYHPLLSTVCFRNCLRDLPEEMIEVINVDSFLLSLLGTFGKAKFQPNIRASIYRRHPGGVWSGKSKKLEYKLKILTFRKIKEYYSNNGGSIKVQKSIKMKLKSLLKMQIFYCVKTGEIKSLFKAIRCYFKL